MSETFTHRVLVRFGEWAAIGELATRDPDLAPGDEVVVRTERGREWGVVLEAPAPAHSAGDAGGDEDDDGRVLRRASDDDRALRATSVEALAGDHRFLVSTCRERGIAFVQIAVERPLGGERIVFYLEPPAGAALDTDQWKALGEALTEHYGEQRVELREVGEEVRLLEVGCGSGGGCSSCGKGDGPRPEQVEAPVITSGPPTPLPMIR